MCGVVGTLSLIMVNSVSNAQVNGITFCFSIRNMSFSLQIRGDTYEGGCLGARGARVWLFLGFVMGFASVIASCWILFADFLDKGKSINKYLHSLIYYIYTMCL